MYVNKAEMNEEKEEPPNIAQGDQTKCNNLNANWIKIH